MKIKQDLKKIAAGAAVLGMLVCSAPKKAEATAFEVMSGHQGVALDTKLDVPLAPGINIFNRNQVGIGYQNNINYLGIPDALSQSKIDYFGLTDLSFNLIGGLDAVLEMQYFSQLGFKPRAGLQYFQELKDLGIYGLATVGLDEANVEVVLDLNCTPKLTEKINLLLGLENVVNFGAQGLNFSIQKIKLGLGLGKDKKLQVGAAANLMEAGSETSYNIGGFFKVNL